MFIIKTLASIVAMLVGFKIVGVRQIAQLTAYDYVSGITIGSIAASMSIDDSINWFVPPVAIIIYALFTRLLAVLTSKSIIFRRFLTGKPTIMIESGKILTKSLKKHNYDVNDLLLECRIKGFFNIDDIESAVMETNGQLSILPKSQKRPVCPDDISVKVDKECLCVNLIIDGRIMYKNLKAYGKEEKWLKDKIHELGIGSADKILLAHSNPDGTVSAYLKTDKPPKDYFM